MSSRGETLGGAGVEASSAGRDAVDRVGAVDAVDAVCSVLGSRTVLSSAEACDV